MAMKIAMEFINTVTLKNDTNKVIRRVKASRKPVVVTQRGVPAVAIVPVEEDQFSLEYDRAFQGAIREGLRDIRAGRRVSLKEFARKHLR